ncbi:MAG: protein-disulfide reductase DsbD domain-containing protein [Sulfitobacter sp.]|uniref:protein-disulfide reductase DsbD domain-containing protein n=1 Tax=Sulfitobacter sp. TaxID=1903071 RepID=UPI003296E2FB
MTYFYRSLAAATAALLTSTALPAIAQDHFDDPVEFEVLQGWELPDGSRAAALRLTLEPGWKTYWRAPGDAGIPPHFDWSLARNLGDVDITWPTPSIYVDNGLRSIGYSGQVVIPMRVTPAQSGKDVRLRATMSLGICSDICVPYQIELDTVLDAPDTSPTPAIVAAMADVPFSAREADVRAATCTLRPTDQGMQIEARVTLPHTGDTEVAVIETGTQGLWISEARTSRQGDTLTATSDMVHFSGEAFAINRSDVRITILGGDYAVDVQGCTAG